MKIAEISWGNKPHLVSPPSITIELHDAVELESVVRFVNEYEENPESAPADDPIPSKVEDGGPALPASELPAPRKPRKRAARKAAAKPSGAVLCPRKGCGRTFRYQSWLNRHLIGAHPGKTASPKKEVVKEGADPLEPRAASQVKAALTFHVGGTAAPTIASRLGVPTGDVMKWVSSAYRLTDIPQPSAGYARQFLTLWQNELGDADRENLARRILKEAPSARPASPPSTSPN